MAKLVLLFVCANKKLYTITIKGIKGKAYYYAIFYSILMLMKYFNK